MQGVDIAVQARAADDLRVGPQAAAIDGQVDVQVVVVGGDDDGRGLLDACFLQDLQVAGAALDVMVVPGGDAGLFFHHPKIDAAGLEGIGHRLADAAAAQHHYRSFGGAFPGAEPDGAVEPVQLGVCAGQHQDGGLADLRLGGRDKELALLPDADHGNTGDLPQTAFGQGFPLQPGSHGRCFGDQQLIEAADDIGFHADPQHPAGQRPAQQLGELKYVRAARQLEDIQGIFHVGIGHGDHAGR